MLYLNLVFNYMALHTFFINKNFIGFCPQNSDIKLYLALQPHLQNQS